MRDGERDIKRRKVRRSSIVEGRGVIKERDHQRIGKNIKRRKEGYEEREVEYYMKGKFIDRRKEGYQENEGKG